jgi:ribosomal protein S18 acetylase RimI-like enzyme
MESKHYLIRELRWNDMDDIVRNYYSYYDELEHNPDLGLTLFNSKPSYEDEIRWFSTLYAEMMRGDCFASVAERDSKVVGLCEVRAMAARECTSHIGTLGIAIHKDSRGMGIGEKLLKRTIDSCRDRFEIIVLDVFIANVAARRLYSKLGFRSMGVLPNAVKRNQTYYDEERMYLSFR